MKNGPPDWATQYLWSTVGVVKAGWLTKDGSPAEWAADIRLAFAIVTALFGAIFTFPPS